MKLAYWIQILAVCLTSGPLPLIPPTKTVQTILISSTCAPCANKLILIIVYGGEYKVWCTRLCIFIDSLFCPSPTHP